MNIYIPISLPFKSYSLQNLFLRSLLPSNILTCNITDHKLTFSISNKFTSFIINTKKYNHKKIARIIIFIIVLTNIEFLFLLKQKIFLLQNSFKLSSQIS